jgi:hypothetical protein
MGDSESKLATQMGMEGCDKVEKFSGAILGEERAIRDDE